MGVGAGATIGKMLQNRGCGGMKSGVGTASLRAGEVVIDSLKDVAVHLTDDETASLVNQAFQFVVAAQLELLVLHHNRKGTNENPKPNVSRGRRAPTDGGGDGRDCARTGRNGSPVRPSPAPRRPESRPYGGSPGDRRA